jgi:hypothetical protein
LIHNPKEIVFTIKFTLYIFWNICLPVFCSGFRIFRHPSLHINVAMKN